MGKTILIALVGLWLFNLARLVAGGLPGHAPVVATIAPAPPAAEASRIAAPVLRLPRGLSIAIGAAEIPGNALSTIAVSVVLAEPAIVALDLYDSGGRLLFSLTSSRLPAGRSRIEMQSTERLEAGDYWVRARAGDEVATAPVEIHG